MNNIGDFLKYLIENGNLATLSTSLDNKKMPVHRWFCFSPGFSHALVETAFNYFGLVGNDSLVFDPFIGSGTTGVVGKHLDVNVIGNESHPFLYKIAKAKTNLKVNHRLLKEITDCTLDIARNRWKNANLSDEPALLRKCYSTDNLKKLVTLRELCHSEKMDGKHRSFLFLIISALLSRCANVGISIPYVSWSSKRIPQDPFVLFKKTAEIVEEDLNNTLQWKNNSTVKIYRHDSRVLSKKIKRDSIDVVFTSPPYLNNFDYGEALKVYTYFWKIAKNWNDITKRIRKKSITCSTTHYKNGKFTCGDPKQMLGDGLLHNAPKSSKKIMEKVKQINNAKNGRKKSFDILTTLYFKDMFEVLKEMHRVLKEKGLAFLVIGDSAPYGVYIPTDSFLGDLAIESGFLKYTLETLRNRGAKWVNLKYRHKLRLRESLLILEK